jgi:arabinogalactan endo-1,4-beta-galactosidase
MGFRNRSRAAVAVAALAALVNAGMLAAPTPAQAVFVTADIKPIESNIAGKSWASATASTGAADA